jgi:hypothetical protein
MGYLADINNDNISLNHLPAKKRLDAIINHPTPKELVQSMPVLDVLWTIREVGFESSIEIIELLHKNQIKKILDLEVWPNDKLDSKKLGGYFSLLFAASHDTAMEQISGLDIELIGLLFKKATQIYDTSLEEEPVEYPDLYSITPNGQFIVCFKLASDPLCQALHTYLEELYARDLSFALQLIRDLRFELTSLLEETSQRWRQSRLQDLGLLPREERLEYFSPIALSEVRKILNTGYTNQRTSDVGLRPFFSLVDIRFPFLRAVVSSLTNEQTEFFWLRIRHITLNMHASLAGDFGDQESIKTTAEYVKFLCELGIMQFCQGLLDNIKEDVKTLEPKVLVRLGRTTLITLRRRLHQAMRDGNILLGEKFLYVDSPLREVAQALCLAEPRFYEGLVNITKHDVRYFTSINEVKATLDAIYEIIFRGRFLGLKGIGLTSTDLLGINLSHAGIIARVLVNRYLDKKDGRLKIETNAMHHINNHDQGLKEDFINKSRQYFDEIACLLANNADELEDFKDRAHNFLNAIFAQLEQNPSLLMDHTS